MSPTDQERLATLEAKQEGMKEQLSEIKKLLEIMPRKISHNTKKQLERCRQLQDSKHARKNLLPVKKPEDDGSIVRKVLVAILSLGTLLGGAVYQFAQESKNPKSGITQQGAKP